MATKPAELYEEDFFAWTRDQASALRRMAKDRWNGPLDLEHLAEEIEDVGSDRRDAVRLQRGATAAAERVLRTAVVAMLDLGGMMRLPP